MELQNILWLVAVQLFSTIPEGFHLVRSESKRPWELYPQNLLFGDQTVEILPLESEREKAATRTHKRKAINVKCHEDSIEIVVQADLFDIGILVNGNNLHLGSESMGLKGVGSPCRADASGAAEFTIHSHFVSCGTKLSLRDNLLVYSNILVYSPELSLGGVQRLSEAAIPLECLYERKFSVDSAPMHPKWSSFAAKIPVVDQLHFSLQLMTDDWHSMRGSSVYFLGNPIHLEASVVMGDHMPLRVYVDHCFATSTPYSESTLRYDFIDRNGCLADAKVTGSSSRFLPRIQDHKLHFTVEAFRFYQQNANLIYITCHLKAVPAFSVVSSNRACSFIDNRWQSLDGSDNLCQSCDLSQRHEEPTATTTRATAPVTHYRTSKPMVDPERSEQKPAKYFRVRPNRKRSRNSAQQAQPRAPVSSPYNGVAKRGTKYERGWSQMAHLGPLVVLPTREVVIPTADMVTTVSTATLVNSTVLRHQEDDSSTTPAEQTDVLTEPEASPDHHNLSDALSVTMSKQAGTSTTTLETTLAENVTSLMGVTENVTEVSNDIEQTLDHPI